MIESHILIGLNLIWIVATIFALSIVLIKLKGNWLHKAISIIFLFLTTFSSISLWRELQGSPKPTVVVNEFIIRAYLIKEPSKGIDGKIWLWGFFPDDVEPKNISIPYSKNMHEKLMTNEGLSEGNPQVLQMGKNSLDLDDYELIDLNSYNLPKE
jgi:hypothetical protein